VLYFCSVVRRLVYPMLPVSLGCPLLTDPSVFSNVYSLCVYVQYFINNIMILQVLKVFVECVTTQTGHSIGQALGSMSLKIWTHIFVHTLFIPLPN